MKNKAQASVGLIVIVAITLIVGVILFQAVAQQVGNSTNLVYLTNYSMGTINNGSTYYFADYKSLSDVSVYNTSSATVIEAGNYTVTNNVINPSTGALTASLKPLPNYMTSRTLSINATAQPTGYISDSGGRAIAGIIILLFAIAVAIVAISPTLRSGIMDMVK